jgi:two-component system NtrC family sensor kinase
VSLRVPASLKLTVPLILLGFAAALSAVNLVYHVPQAERAAEDDIRKRLAQEMSRLQSTLEYLLLKGDEAAAQHEIAVLAHNHDYVFAALTDYEETVIAATRRAWLGRHIADVLPQFDRDEGVHAVRGRPAQIVMGDGNSALLGYSEIMMGSERDELRPSRSGSLYLAYDLSRPKSEARAQVQRQSFYWAGWVTALALAMWLVFHFLLTRRTARLVRAAEQLAAGNLAARSGLSGSDELGRLARAFDVMAREVAETQTRLHRDIAERARVQRALEDSETRLHQILDNSTAVIFVKDTEGRFVFVNRQFTQLFHLRQADVVGKTDLEILPERVAETFRANDRQVLQRNEPVEFEETVPQDDGPHTYISIKFPLRNAQGVAYAVCGISTDITERKRSDESLYQREKLAALGSLLAGVAHELNNPLSVVVARAIMLEEESYPAAQAAASKIRIAAERCARIVRTFLAMARQQQPQRGPVKVNDVVTAALDMTAYTVRTSSIELSLDLAKDVPAIHADADQLHQVLLNLIINAQQVLQDRAGPRRIRVSSRFDPAGQVVRITVADNGPGIPEHLRARVFEPYFTTKPTGVGTGVGLAVSQGIVEAHGGTLAFDCPEMGGAVFSITLPVYNVAAAVADARPARAASASPLRILIVDDEPEIRETLAEILGAAQHNVITAGSGHEALERMAAERYDVIVSDIRMPDLDGRALYREIERRWPEQAKRVVFVTGDTLASASRDSATAYGRPVIEKPFSPDEVRRVVAETGAERGRLHSAAAR